MRRLDEYMGFEDGLGVISRGFFFYCYCEVS